jgi:hypothetical protein
LIGLDGPKVFLAGNHEDTAMRFLRREPFSQDVSFKLWLSQGAGRTLTSLHSGKDLSALIGGIRASTSMQQALRLAERLTPEERYVGFMEGLVYSHKETLDCGHGRVGFRFSHSLHRYDQTLDEQLIGGFDHFQEYLRRPFPHVASLCAYGQFGETFAGGPSDDPNVEDGPIGTPEATLLWNRCHSLRWAFNGEVIVHGHTPTISPLKYHPKNANAPEEFFSTFDKYPVESRLPFIFSRGRGAGYKAVPDNSEKGAVCEFDCGEDGAVEEINVDTGAVCEWGALTALGLSERLLPKGELAVVTVFTTPSDNPQRRPYRSEKMFETIPKDGDVVHRIVKTGRFGADLSDKVKNPLFQFERFRKKYAGVGKEPF